MDQSRAISIINDYRHQGKCYFYSTEFISDYNSTPYITDNVTLLNLSDGKDLKDMSAFFGIKEIKSNCRIKDNYGHSTHCSEYEILYPNNSNAEITAGEPTGMCTNLTEG